MHNHRPEEFARVLDAAADYIAAQPLHPGQTMPGIWELDDGDKEPARLIGVIVTLAIAQVCQHLECELQSAMESYAEVARNVRLKPLGAPDLMAAQHLRDAAAELRAK
ncbi:hypothetical protein KIKIMORA_02990 [Brevundimonas phage vB_BpoS-Kikimora]|uniref:Uncharacterized protein n=1 Tax=Brevundimonas phage vB_BpoS-Kikimora TaxID=2948601 RepID=A0A9E7SKZ5_9CAUD|nr:hypothetical protein KIKIMORA_02990 [Brevundimonas phage vB_BpoS-Kikimora]